MGDGMRSTATTDRRSACDATFGWASIRDGLALNLLRLARIVARTIAPPHATQATMPHRASDQADLPKR
jgi:hypothetical protein